MFRVIFIIALYPFYLHGQKFEAIKSFSEIDKSYIQALLEKDTSSAYGYARQFLRKAKKEENVKAIYYGYNMHAEIAPKNIAHLYYDSIINASKIKPDDINPREAYYNKGVLYYKHLQFNKALKYFTLLLNQSIEDKDLVLEIIARLYTGIINIEHSGEKFETMVRFRKCLKKIEHALSPIESSGAYMSVIRSISEEYSVFGEKGSCAHFTKIKYDFSTTHANDSFQRYLTFIEELNKFSKKKYSVSLDSFPKIYSQFRMSDDFVDRMEVEGSLFLLYGKYLENSFNQKLLIVSFSGIGLLFFIIIFKKVKKKNVVLKTKLKEQTKCKNNCKRDLNISEEIVERIVNELIKFEENHKYLTPNLTSFKLAKILGTNRKYLSYIIKKYRNKSLPNYINELRIDYAIKRLKEDKVFRNYTVDAIAKEVGFLNTFSFSQAFKNKTDLNASTFIANLEKDT
ncbi:helix-turn-helix domain-containing protein [Flavobacteriaceae bacterium F08102]|nr:helix-turn-helix domain-containing protein [Flavobacteriaceae bacterium F08102]